MIAIVGKNFQEKRVDEHVLDSLIASDKLIAFYRSDGWAVIGKDAVRQRHTCYRGQERRRMIHGIDFCMR
jgi:hypothetical protein